MSRHAAPEPKPAKPEKAKLRGWERRVDDREIELGLPMHGPRRPHWTPVAYRSEPDPAPRGRKISGGDVLEQLPAQEDLRPEPIPLGLSSEPATNGRLRPIPVVAISGIDVAAGPDDTGAWPELMVVDGFAVRWGRQDFLAQPDPSSGTLELFDTTGVWALGRELIGRVVTIRWTLPSNPAGSIFFRGRIHKVHFRPKTVQRPDGTTVDGAVVKLGLSSILVDLANRRPVEQVWGVETIETRRARLAGLAGGVLTSLAIATGWNGGSCFPVDVSNSSVLDLIKRLFDTAAFDRYTYDPQAQTIGRSPRRIYEITRTLAQLDWVPTTEADTTRARHSEGAYVTGSTWQPEGGTEYSRLLYVDSAGIEYTPADGLSRDAASRLTRVSIDWENSTTSNGANFEKRTTTRLVPDPEGLAIGQLTMEEVTGQRSAQLDVMLEFGTWVDLLIDEIVDMAQNEGAQWKLGAMRWNTKKTNGFETLQQVESFLAGRETNDYFFLQRSWLAQLGIRPIFSVIGGVIGYRAGGWTLEWDVLPVVTKLPQHAVTWEEMTVGTDDVNFPLRWEDVPGPRRLHPSVTYEDLAFVGEGIGATTSTMGPDTGWDKKR